MKNINLKELLDTLNYFYNQGVVFVDMRVENNLLIFSPRETNITG